MASRDDNMSITIGKIKSILTGIGRNGNSNISDSFFDEIKNIVLANETKLNDFSDIVQYFKINNNFNDFKTLMQKHNSYRERDAYIEKFVSKIQIFSTCKTLKQEIIEYKKATNINVKKTIVAGLRKYFDEKREDIRKYFNNNFVDEIASIFNNCDLSHGNLKGEQRKNYLTKINPSIQNWTESDFMDICDAVVNRLDAAYYCLEKLQNEKPLPKYKEED